MNKLLLISGLLLFFVIRLAAQEIVPASPCGGKPQLKYFIEQELIYPEKALNQNLEGDVSLRYKINEKGQVANVIFLNRLSPECDAEAKRIFDMIEWAPATRLGITIPDSGTFNINFNIKKYNRLCKSRGYKYHLMPFEPIDTSRLVYQYRNLHVAPYPIFTNNNINLAGFIAANLKYPDAAIKQNVSGTVKLGFIVEPHGKISNLTVLNSVGAGCNEEAIRLVRLLKWMPGVRDNMAVRTQMSISINFNLEQGPDGNFNPNVKSSYGG